jgi:hypothetical protein
VTLKTNSSNVLPLYRALLDHLPSRTLQQSGEEQRTLDHLDVMPAHRSERFDPMIIDEGDAREIQIHAASVGPVSLTFGFQLIDPSPDEPTLHSQGDTRLVVRDSCDSKHSLIRSSTIPLSNVCAKEKAI